MSYTVNTDVCLFDLDGTIVNTTVAAESAWRKLCKQYDVNPDELFKVSHGSRTEEMLARFFPEVDNTDSKGVHELEKDIADNYLETIRLIPGAKELLLALDSNPQVPNVNHNTLGKRKWAIVTSGTRYIAFSWFKTILKEVGKPKVFITGEDVPVGKPNPMGYNTAKEQLSSILNVDKDKCRSVVFEDAPVGIKAGNAMGATTIGIASSYPAEKLVEAGADYVVEDLTHVTVVNNTETGCISLQITNPIAHKA
ncbi:similar to Saccharomyces cerevisiae YHR043C DOG2 deoxyglucose-6-phosphate phosphatase [Maudiozyma saulgeensis]|uniref:Similar to Saccharomyces cerevisiae YHR043C DOG2 deoxyglucose-6-phosphate phosphatase n=1 Tax=Maudiozyma saulgeensis TaxID=1789683 RepID=A0A1X7R054_9SACH|nr:similar to Saccharomyces cerevisiae YHR043C DOG2 deoxyglucose-6-phosphate phosphatase [Kazachstania saulgeensis]